MLNYKNRKCLMRLTSIALLFGLIFSASAVQVNSSDAVKEFVRSYYGTVDQSLSQLIMSEELFQYYESGTDNFEYIVLDTMVNHRKMQIGDLTWSEYTTELSFQNVEENDGVYTVEVEKDTIMQYRCMNGEQSEEWEVHKLQIKTTSSGDYQVISDEYENEIRDILLENAKAANANPQSVEYKQAEKVLLADSRQEVKEAKAEQAKIKAIYESGKVLATEVEEDELSSGISTMATSGSFKFHSYNRTAAKNYAYKYVKNPNPAYMNFEGMGGNCTNFTSQCLKAGGIVQVRAEVIRYYVSSSNRAPAWTGADQFRKYYRNNKGSNSVKGLSAKKCSFKDSRLGDLVQNVTKTNGVAKHTMFISSPICENDVTSDVWNRKIDVGVCQNSINKAGRKKNVPLSSLKPNAGCVREYVHINGSYS